MVTHGGELTVALGDALTLRSPLIIGAYDAHTSAASLLRLYSRCKDAGAIVLKTTTAQPRDGYREPRVARFGDGLLVASGMRNPGIHRMCEELQAFKEHGDEPKVFASIAPDPDQPTTALDLADELSALAIEYARAGADAIEINLSCPHSDPKDTERTCVPAQDETLVHDVVAAVTSALRDEGAGGFPIIPKLTGWGCDPVKTAQAAQRAGAGAVIISNLFPGTGYYTGIQEDPSFVEYEYQLGEALIGHRKGGVTGRAMGAMVLLMIERVHRAVELPVIASGGCASDLDALVQALMAGASAVEAVTPFYSPPGTLEENRIGERIAALLASLRAYLKANGMAAVTDLIGLPHRGRDHQQIGGVRE